MIYSKSFFCILKHPKKSPMESESDVISTDPSDYSDMESSLSDSETSHHQSSSNSNSSNSMSHSHSMFGFHSSTSPFNPQLPHNIKTSQILSIESIIKKQCNDPMDATPLQKYETYKHESNENSHSNSKEPKIKKELNTSHMKFERSELQKQSLDELLAKTLTFRPNLRWNEKNIYCRYCGARASQSFYDSPMGLLCFIHHTLQQSGKLNVALFEEPKNINHVINKSSNTEKQYLIDILCQIDKDEDINSTYSIPKRRSLRSRSHRNTNNKNIKRENKNNFLSDFDEDGSSLSDSDHSSFNSSYSMSSEHCTDSDIDSSNYSSENSNCSDSDLEMNTHSHSNTNNKKNKNQKQRQTIIKSEHRQIKYEKSDIMELYKTLFEKTNQRQVQIKKENMNGSSAKLKIEAIKVEPVTLPNMNHNDVNLKQLKHELFSKRLCTKFKFEKMSKYKTLEQLQKNNYTENELKILKKKRRSRYKAEKATKSTPKRVISDVFDCKECGKSFIGANVFYAHSVAAHDNRYCFDCEECDKSYTSKNNLLYHQRKIHDKVINFHCKRCKRPFFEKNEWRRHSEKCQSDYYIIDCLLCDDINITFESGHKYKTHMKEVHNVPRAYKCIYCVKRGKDISYETKPGLDMHFRRDHLRLRPWKCSKCDKAFYEKNCLEQHQRVHDKKKPFMCKHCGARFTGRSSMRCHIRNIHLKIKRFECKYCGKKFSEKTGLRSHAAAIHGDDSMARFECHVCKKRWYDKGTYFKHMANAHKAKDPLKEMIKRGECPIAGCDKKYNSKHPSESVKYHLVNTHKLREYAKYECKKCGKLFYDKTRYSEHKEKESCMY